ncbi:acyl-CoA dehydrogenase family protein [Nocardia grenadensis]|uniref:acyl-CoA dehydrogenase family protein n=1 Tax=Nocardia grenadensis TaxID=931537 RepID=UPI003D7612B8
MNMFDATDEEKDLRAAVRDFVRRECPPGAWEELDQSHTYPSELMKKLAATGWMGVAFPDPDTGERHGRWGSMLGIVTEELGKVSYSLASNYMKVAGYGETILHHGSDAQRETIVPRLADGELLLAISISEPGAGSDAAAVATRAVRDGDHYVLNGTKHFSTCSAIADYIILLARTGDDRYGGLSVFLVPPGTEGITFTEMNKMGIWTNPTYNITLDNARIPASALLGGEGQGWKVITHSLDIERFSLAAAYTGAAQSAYDYAADYARTREQFGKPIGKFQVVQHKLVDMHLAVDHARLVTQRAAELLNRGVPCRREASTAKLVASEAYMKVANDGLQILGGLGYTMESPMQRHFRDAKLGEIGGGSSEIQRNILARELGL